MPYSDLELLQRFAIGDQQAFAQIFSIHFRQMCYYGEEMIGNRQVAEDLVVDSIVKLYQKRPVFENTLKLKSYLFSILHNAALDYIKANKLHQSIHQKIGHTSDREQDSAELLMIRSEALNELYREIARLPEQCRQVVYKIFVEGKTVREIAEEMGLAPQTVLNQKSRGIALLKSSLLKKNLLSPLVIGYLWALMD